MTAAVDCLVNQQRVRFGLPALNVVSKLNQSAQRWTNYLTSSGQYYHGDFADREGAAGYDWQLAGENLAAGFMTPRDVVAAWMDSTEHCRNILWPEFRDMGTGETPRGIDIPMWLQDFGTSMNERPLSSDFGPRNGCPYNIPDSYQETSANSGSSSSGSPPDSTPSDPGSSIWPTSPSDTTTSPSDTGTSSPPDAGSTTTTTSSSSPWPVAPS